MSLKHLKQTQSNCWSRDARNIEPVWSEKECHLSIGHFTEGVHV